MNEISKSKIACPDAVIRAGARLMALRRKAEELEAAIDAALPDIRAGIDYVCVNHGAKGMQAGPAVQALREVQTAPGKIMCAHDALRRVLGEVGIAEPTNEQLLAVAAEKAKAPGNEIESIR